MAGIDELERMIEHVAGDVQKTEENHEKLSKNVHDFMLKTARNDGEIAGYIREAANNISVIRKESADSVAAVQTQVKESSEAIWSAVNVLKDSLSEEIKTREVADKNQEGALDTAKVEFKSSVRMAGYTKIIAFLSSAALITLSGFLAFGS